MNIAVQAIRILVGVLFILSGLVKANDPLGLTYKMQEFFEVWNGDLAASGFFLKDALISFFHFLHAHSLALSVLMIALEIMAGVALLIGWQKKAVLTLLLALIIFFTFLTGYAYASGKFKNCGCFGDCLPITPLASFLKDVALLLAILFLFFARQYIRPLASRKMQWSVLTVSLLFSFGFQWYVLNYLPVVDCLPFKQGANIAEGMKIPPTAVPDSFAIRFVYQKEGKQYEFSPEGLPADLDTYQFVERQDKLVRKGNAEPAIKGFALSGPSNEDSTQVVLTQPYAVLYFHEGKGAISESDKANFQAVYQQAFQQCQIPVYVITTALENAIQQFDASTLPGAAFFKVDYTAFRTAARTNPCIYLLQQGTVVDKWSGKESGEAIASIKAIAKP